jgi:hypothetical protein
MIIKRNWRDAHPTIAHHSGGIGDCCHQQLKLTDSSHLLVLVLELLPKKLLSSFITKSGCSSGIQ